MDVLYLLYFIKTFVAYHMSLWTLTHDIISSYLIITLSCLGTSKHYFSWRVQSNVTFVCKQYMLLLLDENSEKALMI